MCRICTSIKKLPQDQQLARIGEEIKLGKNPEHFKKLLDTILGTEEPEQDPALDRAWERAHRPS